MASRSLRRALRTVWRSLLGGLLKVGSGVGGASLVEVGGRRSSVVAAGVGGSRRPRPVVAGVSVGVMEAKSIESCFSLIAQSRM